MVPGQAGKRKTLKIEKPSCWGLYWVIMVILLAAVAAIGWVMLHPEPEVEVVEEATEEVEVEPEASAYEIAANTEVEVAKIDFQPTVDAWVNSIGGNKSVLIYDLDRDETVGEYGLDESYNTASLYKLFVVYEGYRRVQSGEWQADAAAGSTGRTILECLDLAIRESNSACAEVLWGMIGRGELEEIIANDYDIHNSQISMLISNAPDIMAMMKIFYEHREITDEGLLTRMKDSFLNQPITTYNWRQGLPSGFTRANVYNKVGWDFNPDGRYWNIYHDAAIVEFPEQDRHFIVVVMTNRVAFERIRELGRTIEDLVVNSE